MLCSRLLVVFLFFVFKQKRAYEITRLLEFRRVLFRSGDTCAGISGSTICPNFKMTANRYLLIGKFLPQISFSRICMNIPVADNINSSDLCIYDATGNLVVNAGPQKMGISGTECFKPVQSTPIVLPARLSFYGATSAGST